MKQLAIVLALIAGLLVGAARNGNGNARPEARYGLPSADCVYREGFVRSPAGHRCPWTIEYRTPEHFDGKAKRDGHSFTVDWDQPVEWRWSPAVYAHSGYDLGHRAPAEDCTYSEAAMAASFEATNAMPQTPELNRGPLAQCEEAIREIAKAPGAKSWIVTLELYVPDERGVVKHGRLGQQDIPSHVGKAVLTEFPSGRLYVKAWLLENSHEPKAFGECETTIDALEQLSALDLFAGLEDGIEQRLEAGK